MRAWICDRCGDVLLDDIPCRCGTPYDPVAVLRRHRDAVSRFRDTQRLTARQAAAPRRVA